VPRARTTKARAQRIDLNYYKRPIPLRRWRFWLCAILPAVSFVWIGWKLVGRDWRPYSSGQLSSGHALLTEDCATCHEPAKSVYREHASEKACFACHDGPAHRANQVAAEVPQCGSCHLEHRGRVRLASTPDASCSRCHADLKTTSGPATVVRNITSLQTDHPDMAIFREKRKDPGTIRVNHYVHMKANLLGPHGAVQLECADCHKQLVAAARGGWKYAGAPAAAPEAAPAAPAAAMPAALKGDLYAPDPAHALMSMPRFAESCAACHLLQFDSRLADQVPHDKPEVVHAFVVKKFEAYIAAHPEELREGGGAVRRIPTQPAPASARVVTASQWVAESTQQAEKLLWGKTCRQCHVLSMAEAPALPKVEPANYTPRWLPKTRFDHDAHRGFACASCHPKGLTSKDTADILVPQIATCKTCHAPGAAHVESRCFECHAYHDWSKRKEIRPTFVPRALKAAATQGTTPAGQ
jgi:cytochrome c5